MSYTSFSIEITSLKSKSCIVNAIALLKMWNPIAGHKDLLFITIELIINPKMKTGIMFAQGICKTAKNPAERILPINKPARSQSVLNINPLKKISSKKGAINIIKIPAITML